MSQVMRRFRLKLFLVSIAAWAALLAGCGGSSGSKPHVALPPPGVGAGLPGAKRLMDEFEVDSVVGQGTTITMKKWRRSI